MSEHREASFDTIRYEVDADDRVATVTLDRPEALNAFDRRMCEEVRDVWHLVKEDDRVNAVVVRASGDRAFSAGLDTKQSFGQPDLVWNHVDPGELPEPEMAEVLEAGGVRGAGHVHRGRVLLPQRGRRGDLLRRRHVLRFARHLRIRVGDRADRPHAAHRPRRHAAHGAHRQPRAGVRRDRAAHRPRHRGGRARRALAHAHDLATLIASYPAVATQGTVRAIWESLDKPYRAAVEQGLMYTRLGNPVGAEEIARTGVDRRPPRIR